MTDKERVIQFLDNIGVSKNKFYTTTGLGNGYLDKPGRISHDKGDRIYSRYPQLNKNWIETGMGTMLLESINVLAEPIQKYSNDTDWKEKYYNEVELHNETLKKYSEALEKIDIYEKKLKS
jgi:hypothetical protein